MSVKARPSAGEEQIGGAVQHSDAQVTAAYHAAGRGVAGVLRGWTEGFIEPTVEAVGPAWPTVTESSRPFVAYAGVWATARRHGDLAGEPGVSDRRLTEAMCAHPGDATIVGAAQLEVASVLRAAGAADEWGWLAGVGTAWRAELEQMWPVVQHVAVLLIAGRCVSAARVRRLTDDRLVGGLAI